MTRALSPEGEHMLLRLAHTAASLHDDALIGYRLCDVCKTLPVDVQRALGAADDITALAGAIRAEMNPREAVREALEASVASEREPS